MFEYISGKLIQKTKDYAVIDAGGIGYRIYSTMSSLSSLGEAGDTARLYIYMNIKNSSDTFSLYGFATPEERSTFEMILGVSGIGAKTAAAHKRQQVSVEQHPGSWPEGGTANYSRT